MPGAKSRRAGWFRGAGLAVGMVTMGLSTGCRPETGIGNGVPAEVGAELFQAAEGGGPGIWTTTPEPAMAPWAALLPAGGAGGALGPASGGRDESLPVADSSRALPGREGLGQLQARRARLVTLRDDASSPPAMKATYATLIADVDGQIATLLGSPS